MRRYKLVPSLSSLVPILAWLVSCVPGSGEESSVASASEVSESVPEWLALHETIARRALIARDADPVAGYIQIGDDQLRNRHFATASFFKVTDGGAGSPYPGGACVETVYDEDGVKCVISNPCTPPPGDGGTDPGPQPPPTGGSFDGGTGKIPPPITVGDIEIAARFDTIRLTTPGQFGYGYVSRSGPFWNGDGDQVKLSIAGKPEEGIPAVTQHFAAPVPDALASVPKTADRAEPLSISWRYADGKSPASGYMTFSIAQFSPPAGPGKGPSGPSIGSNVLCGAASSRRSMTLPSSILQRFQPGRAFTSMSSTLEERVVIVSGPLRVDVDVTARVDMGADEPTDPTMPPISGGIMFR